jgi:hypothetical protein
LRICDFGLWNSNMNLIDFNCFNPKSEIPDSNDPKSNEILNSGLATNFLIIEPDDSEVLNDK